MALYGTDVPPFEDPESPIDVVICVNFHGCFFFKPTLMEIEWGVVNDYGDRMGIYEAYNIHPSKLNDIQ